MIRKIIKLVLLPVGVFLIGTNYTVAQSHQDVNRSSVIRVKADNLNNNVVSYDQYKSDVKAFVHAYSISGTDFQKEKINRIAYQKYIVPHTTNASQPLQAYHGIVAGDFSGMLNQYETAWYDNDNSVNHNIQSEFYANFNALKYLYNHFKSRLDHNMVKTINDDINVVKGNRTLQYKEYNAGTVAQHFSDAFDKYSGTVSEVQSSNGSNNNSKKIKFSKKITKQKKFNKSNFAYLKTNKNYAFKLYLPTGSYKKFATYLPSDQLTINDGSDAGTALVQFEVNGLLASIPLLGNLNSAYEFFKSELNQISTDRRSNLQSIAVMMIKSQGSRGVLVTGSSVGSHSGTGMITYKVSPWGKKQKPVARSKRVKIDKRVMTTVGGPVDLVKQAEKRILTNLNKKFHTHFHIKFSDEIS